MTKDWCVVDKPLGFSKDDTDMTVRLNTDHDMRWLAVCEPAKFKELYPEYADIIQDYQQAR